jgi:myo-inositol-1(or 4)-monophosphatase
MNTELIVGEIKIICENTGKFIRSHFGQLNENQIITKSKNSLVSFVDQQAEKMIIESLVKILPEAAFMTEEAMIKNSENEYQWIVDPLDGTTNYMVGIPHFSISIALKKNDEVILGVVYDVMQQDMYHAVVGKGAFVNENKIHVADSKKLDECAIATGFPYDKGLIGEAHQNTLMYFVKNARILRRLGSAALDLCFVAKGTFDLYYEKHLNAWDIAAGSLIVQEAGGTIIDFSKSQNYLACGEIIAFAPGLEEEAEKIIGFFEN